MCQDVTESTEHCKTSGISLDSSLLSRERQQIVTENVAKNSNRGEFKCRGISRGQSNELSLEKRL